MRRVTLLALLALTCLCASSVAAVAAVPKPTPAMKLKLARIESQRLLNQMALGRLPVVCKAMSVGLRSRYAGSECQQLSLAKLVRLADEKASAHLERSSSAARDAAHRNNERYPVSELASAIKLAEPSLAVRYVTSVSEAADRPLNEIAIDTTLSDAEHVFLYAQSRSGKVLKIVADLGGEAISDTGIRGTTVGFKRQIPSAKIILFRKVGKSYNARALVKYGLGEQEEVSLQLTPYLTTKWRITQLDSAVMVVKVA